MSFRLGKKQVFIGRFQFLSSLSNTSGKNLDKNDFKNLSQEFDSEVLDLVRKRILSL